MLFLKRFLNFRVRHSLQRRQRTSELRDLDFRILRPRLHCLDPFPGKSFWGCTKSFPVMLHFCIEWPICRRQNVIFRRQSDARTICLSISCVFVQKKRISIFDFRIPTSTSKDDFSPLLIFAKNIWGSLSRTPAAIIRTLQDAPFRCEPDNHLRRIVDGLKCRKWYIGNIRLLTAGTLKRHSSPRHHRISDL